MTDLNGALVGPYSVAADVNDRGQVTGWVGLSPQSQQAFVWQDGIVTLLGPSPAA